LRKILQVPLGLKRKALEIADKYGDVFIDMENRYGACDLPILEAKALGVEKIIHLGHCKFMESDIPVEYVELKEVYNPITVLQKNFDKFKSFKKIGLISSIQFTGSLSLAKKFFEDNEKEAFIGKNSGRILGCDITSALSIEKNVDVFLFIGSGKFHALGVALKYDKPVLVLDVERNEVYDIEKIKRSFLKQKYTAIGLAKHAQKFGILVSVKTGQMNIELAEKIKKFLENKDRKAYVLIFNEIKPEKLEGLDLDCYVNTACPRIAIEDRELYNKPILSYDELMESFK
jgi:2-(3-amino-3-carboxypropyl)histidine synthase